MYTAQGDVNPGGSFVFEKGHNGFILEETPADGKA